MHNLTVQTKGQTWIKSIPSSSATYIRSSRMKSRNVRSTFFQWFCFLSFYSKSLSSKVLQFMYFQSVVIGKSNLLIIIIIVAPTIKASYVQWKKAHKGYVYLPLLAKLMDFFFKLNCNSIKTKNMYNENFHSL